MAFLQGNLKVLAADAKCATPKAFQGFWRDDSRMSSHFNAKIVRMSNRVVPLGCTGSRQSGGMVEAEDWARASPLVLPERPGLPQLGGGAAEVETVQ